jgi:hypothetical protein
VRNGMTSMPKIFAPWISIPCKADPDVWMKDCGTHFEYVLVYVDDLVFIGKKSQAFFVSLTSEHGFKLEGVGKSSYHQGGDFFCDSDLAWRAQSYVEKMLINYETMVGSKTQGIFYSNG